MLHKQREESLTFLIPNRACCPRNKLCVYCGNSLHRLGESPVLELHRVSNDFSASFSSSAKRVLPSSSIIRIRTSWFFVRICSLAPGFFLPTMTCMSIVGLLQVKIELRGLRCWKACKCEQAKACAQGLHACTQDIHLIGSFGDVRLEWRLEATHVHEQHPNHQFGQ